MKPEKLIDNIRIRHHECDPHGRLKLHCLMDYLQNAAAEHADMLGFGMDDLGQRNLIWVLSRLKLTIARMPRLGEKLTVETYPTGVEKIFALRQYCIRSESEILVGGTGAWLVLDRRSYRIMPPDRVMTPDMPLNESEERFHPLPGKLPPHGAAGQQQSFRAGWADTDLNDHLNNAVYARYLTDLFPSVPDFSTVQINFVKSAKPGDSVNCTLELLPDGRFSGSGKDDSGKEYFQAAGEIR